MISRLTCAIAMLGMVALPALAQTQTPQSGQNSGAGIAGQPGGKNGPAPKSTASNDQKTTQTQDTSKIQGKPGSKSGPAVQPPSKQQ
jgi:Spy/CpxP family protein refolding chaperone